MRQERACLSGVVLAEARGFDSRWGRLAPPGFPADEAGSAFRLVDPAHCPQPSARSGAKYSASYPDRRASILGGEVSGEPVVAVELHSSRPKADAEPRPIRTRKPHTPHREALDGSSLLLEAHLDLRVIDAPAGVGGAVGSSRRRQQQHHPRGANAECSPPQWPSRVLWIVPLRRRRSIRSKRLRLALVQRPAPARTGAAV